jgi:hypothetical protein
VGLLFERLLPQPEVRREIPILLGSVRIANHLLYLAFGIVVVVGWLCMDAGTGTDRKSQYTC